MSPVFKAFLCVIALFVCLWYIGKLLLAFAQEALLI